MEKSRNTSWIILLFIFTSGLNAQASVDYLVDVVKRLNIPHAEFKGTPLREVLDFLQDKSAELDVREVDPTKKGFNIVLYTGKSDDKIDDIPITLKLDNVSFDVAFKRIAAFAKMKHVIESHAVFFAPLNWNLPNRNKDANIPDVMKNITVPSLNFSNTSFIDALKYLERQSVALDLTEQEPVKKGIKVIIQPPYSGWKGDEVKITMRMRNVPLLNALDYTAALAGMQCEVEIRTVLITPITDDKMDYLNSAEQPTPLPKSKPK
ncbi:MAG: hypothetical protein L3J39_06595 [Verrucomicrobiales bacterium]|nr:hypothetical protein [Verrucomicrobiales bacterium]